MENLLLDSNFYIVDGNFILRKTAVLIENILWKDHSENCKLYKILENFLFNGQNPSPAIVVFWACSLLRNILITNNIFSKIQIFNNSYSKYISSFLTPKLSVNFNLIYIYLLTKVVAEGYNQQLRFEFNGSVPPKHFSEFNIMGTWGIILVFKNREN